LPGRVPAAGRTPGLPPARALSHAGDRRRGVSWRAGGGRAFARRTFAKGGTMVRRSTLSLGAALLAIACGGCHPASPPVDETAAAPGTAAPSAGDGKGAVTA